jgi:hypothetical protein
MIKRKKRLIQGKSACFDYIPFCHHLAYVVCHPLTFHILIFSSESPQPNEKYKIAEIRGTKVQKGCFLSFVSGAFIIWFSLFSL